MIIHLPERSGRSSAVCLLLLISLAMAAAQQTPSASWQPQPDFPLVESPITLRQAVQPEKPFTVAGPCGALLGQQNGRFESWIFPVKLFSRFTIQAHLDGYDVPIDVNREAAEIEVAPDRTTITYSDSAFTLKEILFATQCSRQDGVGVMALFQISAVRPLTLTFSFTPEVKPMWPAPASGSIDAEWIKVTPHAGENPAGWFMLHTDFANLAAGIALPGSDPGGVGLYEEEPRLYPLQFVLPFNPKRDSGRYFPLLMAAGTTNASATEQALGTKLAMLNEQAATLYSQTADRYAHFFDTRLTAETPDAAFDRDLQWATISIDAMRVRHGGEAGMVAGFLASGSSARPGFGWFFGRDTLFTAWAIDSYGDYSLTREALTFLIHRQREDGKMPHEFSQTAEQVDWAHLPYEYAAADSTPLFLIAMEDYVSASGDVEFLRTNWPAVEKAWNFETTHDADGDGIYDNSQGTAWVESWPPGMPQQEIYLASLDQQASSAMAALCKLTGHASEADRAQQRASVIAKKIDSEYTEPDGMFAFSHNANGSQDKSATIYPAIAWWSGTASLPHADAMFARWASHEFSTDWGTRDVGENEAVYDPISYHQGSVWPLFTGWAALAEYRSGHDLAGYAHMMQNAGLITGQDLGSVTELLSGAYFTPLLHSTSHQMWSSAMVMVPAVRGLFGVSVDALQNVITVDPHLPAQWPKASLHHLRVGDESVDLHYERRGGEMVVRLQPADANSKLKLASLSAGAKVLREGREVSIPLAAVEIGMSYGAMDALPSPGAPTQMLKVLDQQYGPRSLTLTLEAQGSSKQLLFVRQNNEHEHLSAEGGVLRTEDEELAVTFPAGTGYQRQVVVLRW